MKGEHPLRFYQYPNGKFGSYIRWAYLEEAYKEGELNTTTDYNNWLTEYNKLDARSFLYKIQRIDVGDSSYWSADKGLVVEKTWLDNTGNLSSDYWKISNLSTNPYLMLTQGSTWYIQGYQGYLYLGAGWQKSMRIDSSGNVLAAGGITMYSSSDERLKQNIRTFNASKELMNLGGVFKFEYTDEEVERNGIYKGTHIGLIYQNVKNTSLAKMCYEREDGYGALNYLDSSFISLLAGVGVEHETRIQRLERENVELKKELEHVRRTMEAN
jgi:hypothetical protein